MIPKLNGAWYAFRSVVRISNTKNAYAYIRPDIKYGIDIVEKPITMVRFSR